MLECCVLTKHLNVAPSGYTHVDHPVQKAIMNQVKIYSELNDFPMEVDGCSAPIPFMPLYNIAIMFQKLAGSNYPELNVYMMPWFRTQ